MCYLFVELNFDLLDAQSAAVCVFVSNVLVLGLLFYTFMVQLVFGFLVSWVFGVDVLDALIGSAEYGLWLGYCEICSRMYWVLHDVV